MASLKKKGLHVKYSLDSTATQEIPETSGEIEHLSYIDPGRVNHSDYYRLLEVAKDKGEKPKVELISCKRIVDSKSGKEYAVFFLNISTLHYDGSTVLSQAWRDWGIWYQPTWRRLYNGKKSRWEESDQVSGAITHFDYPWGPKLKIKTPLDDKATPLEELITPETRFFLIEKGVKHKVRKDDWMNMPRAELVDKATGSSPQAEALKALTDAITKAQALAGARSDA